MKNKDIIVIFNPTGLTFDMQEVSGKAYTNDALVANFKLEPYKSLFYFGFDDKHPDMSVSLSFLHNICQNFISTISKDPDIEITKNVKMPETAVFLDMLRSVPFAVGVEYISIGWFKNLLVENKSDEYPFAFLATYSTEIEENKKAAHVPLKNALLLTICRIRLRSKRIPL